MNPYMQKAVEEALQGIQAGHGGPFGSVIVRNGEIIATGHNEVLLQHDPTCHGEITAIRNACRKLGTHDLSGCELYTTAEPCPMCLGAILWATINHIYYGCTIQDTADIGFRDEKFYQFFHDKQQISEQLDRDGCLDVFSVYQNLKQKQQY